MSDGLYKRLKEGVRKSFNRALGIEEEMCGIPIKADGLDCPHCDNESGVTFERDAYGRPMCRCTRCGGPWVLEIEE